MNDSREPLAVDALVFDAYGTLFDVHSVTQAVEGLLPGRASAVSSLWGTKQLEYTWLASLMASERYAREDFAVLTARALDFALDALGLALDPRGRAELLDAYGALAPFPEVPAALSALA